jgi:hypothetical protein
LAAYKQNGDWRNALSVAHQLGLSTQQIEQFARELTTVLLSRYQSEDAAYILETYCKDYPAAVNALTQGRLWDHAIYLCHKYNASDLVQKEIVPAIVEAHDAILAEVNESLIKLPKYHNRLIVVRANKYVQGKTGTFVGAFDIG